MVVAGMSFRGPLKARFVPINSKMNAKYYIDHILKPVIEKELPTLFPNEMHKVFIHHDKASVHTADPTIAFLTKMSKKYGIHFQEKQDIIVKGADVSPMASEI